MPPTNGGRRSPADPQMPSEFRYVVLQPDPEAARIGARKQGMVRALTNDEVEAGFLTYGLGRGDASISVTWWRRVSPTGAGDAPEGCYWPSKLRFQPAKLLMGAVRTRQRVISFANPLRYCATLRSRRRAPGALPSLLARKARCGRRRPASGGGVPSARNQDDRTPTSAARLTFRTCG